MWSRSPTPVQRERRCKKGAAPAAGSHSRACALFFSSRPLEAVALWSPEFVSGDACAGDRRRTIIGVACSRSPLEGVAEFILCPSPPLGTDHVEATTRVCGRCAFPTSTALASVRLHFAFAASGPYRTHTCIGTQRVEVELGDIHMFKDGRGRGDEGWECGCGRRTRLTAKEGRGEAG